MTDASFDLTRITEDWDTYASPEQLEAAAIRYGLCAELAAGKDFLEVGCGRGTGLAVVAEVAASAAGLDAMTENIARCREQGVPADLRVGDATALPYDDDTFDVVASLEVLYYIGDQQAAVCEMTRVCRPGGAIVIVVANPARQGFHGSPGATTYPDIADLRSLMTAAGCASVDVSGAFPFVEQEDTLLTSVFERVRRVASRFHLIPSTIDGRGRLKRLLYRGRAKPIRAFRELDVDPRARLDSIAPGAAAPYTVLYAVGTVA